MLATGSIESNLETGRIASGQEASHTHRDTDRESGRERGRYPHTRREREEEECEQTTTIEEYKLRSKDLTVISCRQVPVPRFHVLMEPSCPKGGRHKH